MTEIAARRGIAYNAYCICLKYGSLRLYVATVGMASKSSKARSRLSLCGEAEAKAAIPITPLCRHSANGRAIN